MRVIIIGCTFAGMTAASQILRSHPETEVTIYDRNAVVPSITYDINDYDDQDAEQPRLRTELSSDQLYQDGFLCNGCRSGEKNDQSYGNAR